MRFSPGLSLVGALLFELNGTFAWFGHAPYNPVAFLPMILLGVETAFSDEGSLFQSWRWIAVGLALSIYAGFPETAYIDGLFAFGWLVVRGTTLRGDKLKRFIVRIAIGGIVGIILSAPILLAFFIELKNGFVGRHLGAFAQAHIPLGAIPMLVVPYIYGPIEALCRAQK